MRPDGQTTERVLSFIQEFTREEGYPPSVREIQHGVGLGSTSVVSYHLARLEDEGKLRRVPGRARAIILLGAAARRWGATV